MIKRFIQLGSSISKVVIYSEIEDELSIMSGISKALHPIKLAIEYRQDSNLLTAETSLQFIMDKLQLQNTSFPLPLQLVPVLSVRIKQRRTNLGSFFRYLKNPLNIYLYDLNEIFP